MDLEKKNETLSGEWKTKNNTRYIRWCLGLDRKKYTGV